MTSGSALEEPEPPWIRNPDFVDYLGRLIDRKRDEGVTINQICDAGDLSRSQFKRWRGISGPQSIPDPETLIRFCVGNGLELAEPYRILGWGDPPRLGSADQTVEAALVAIADALDDDALDDDDRAEVLAQLDLLVAQLAARAERRRGPAGE